jgi:HK97 gp10 family phage protein
VARNENPFESVIAALETGVERAIVTVLEEQVVPEARSRCPVGHHKHHLRDAIHVQVELEGVYLVGGDDEAWYGHMVEHGTSHSPPHPFLMPAFEMHRPAIVAAAAAAIGRAA